MTTPNTAAVRPHPEGGFTIATPVPGTETARIYVGRFSTERAAELELARRRGQAEGEAMLQKIRGGLAA